MERRTATFQKYLFVCENVRDGGRVCCGPRSTGFVEYLKNYVKTKGLARKVRVSRTGCLDVCAKGPNILVFPDNVWYSAVTREDLDQILREQIDPLIVEESTLPIEPPQLRVRSC
ncbi:MAG: (2Fe-2S) ferredoxin domain-containing protein [Deltaproteobacteria bacterium]|nr:(2Fe-2S) ferredoxin domain-containing protein [Deltaproteobacteria bacterium]